MDTEATADDSMRRPIGAILGAARVASGLELTDVARDTRVPVRHLAAIEADDHDHLPALPYAIGFVKAFARVVGVDPEMAGAHFRAETSKAAHVPLPPTMTPLDERRLPPRGGRRCEPRRARRRRRAGRRVERRRIRSVTPGRAAGRRDAIFRHRRAFGGSYREHPASAGRGDREHDRPRRPRARRLRRPLRAAHQHRLPHLPFRPPCPVATAAGAVAAPAGTGPASGVVITASEDAWFKVSVYDAAVGKVVTVKTGVLAKGERYVPPARPGLRLWTGRAGAAGDHRRRATDPAARRPGSRRSRTSVSTRATLRARLAAAPATGVPAAR